MLPLCSVVGLYHSGAPLGGHRSPKVAFPRGHPAKRSAGLRAAFRCIGDTPISSVAYRSARIAAVMPEQARGVDPIDPGLIDLFDRRGCSLSYGLTPDREEVDVVARAPDGSVRLVQVCVDLQDPATCARELRPLESLREASGAEQLDLVVLDPPPWLAGSTRRRGGLATGRRPISR